MCMCLQWYYLKPLCVKISSWLSFFLKPEAQSKFLLLFYDCRTSKISLKKIDYSLKKISRSRGKGKTRFYDF